MQDKTIRCRDCDQDFVFTAGEQEFYAQKGFSEPIRCPNCRAARKASRGEGGFTSAPRQEREMFPAVCAQCGKETQVPFQPRDGRPVYCSDCFSKQRSAGGGYDRPSRGGYDRSSSGGYDRPFGDDYGRPSRGGNERRSSRERSGGYGRDRRRNEDRYDDERW